MTSHIAKLFQLALTTLAICPISFTLDLHAAAAESPDPIGELHDLTEKIARNPLSPAPSAQSPEDNADAETGSARDRSMAYVKSGYEAQDAGNEELALANYYTAMKVDPTNGYAFLLAGRMLGNTEAGIDCLKAAAQLFVEQNDRPGYELASELLQASNAAN
jgi:hypothetical protein